MGDWLRIVPSWALHHAGSAGQSVPPRPRAPGGCARRAAEWRLPSSACVLHRNLYVVHMHLHPKSGICTEAGGASACAYARNFPQEICIRSQGHNGRRRSSNLAIPATGLNAPRAPQSPNGSPAPGDKHASSKMANYSDQYHNLYRWNAQGLAHLGISDVAPAYAAMPPQIPPQMSSLLSPHPGQIQGQNNTHLHAQLPMAPIQGPPQGPPAPVGHMPAPHLMLAPQPPQQAPPQQFQHQGYQGQLPVAPFNSGSGLGGTPVETPPSNPTSLNPSSSLLPLNFLASNPLLVSQLLLPNMTLASAPSSRGSYTPGWYMPYQMEDEEVYRYPDVTTLVNSNSNYVPPLVELTFVDLMVCTVCGKRIARDMTRHMRTHQEVKRLVCLFPRKLCRHKLGKFNRLYELKKHLLNNHFVFDLAQVKRAYNLRDKLASWGSCACGRRFQLDDWLDNHILGGERCPLLEQETGQHG